MKPTLAPDDIAGVAERLRQSYNAQPIGPVRTAFPGATIADAYAIQQANTAWWTLNGRTRVGAKIGLTAKAVQKQLGVDQPDFGTLFSDMAVLDAADVPFGMVNSLGEALEQPVVVERGLLKETQHPVAGTVRVGEADFGPALGTVTRSGEVMPVVEQTGLAYASKARGTMTEVLKTLRRVLSVAISQKLITEEPVDLDIPARIHKLPIAYEEADVQALLAAARTLGPNYVAMVLLGIDGGLRRGEILGLKWSDLSFARAHDGPPQHRARQARRAERPHRGGSRSDPPPRRGPRRDQAPARPLRVLDRRRRALQGA